MKGLHIPELLIAALILGLVFTLTKCDTQPACSKSHPCRHPTKPIYWKGP